MNKLIQALGLLLAIVASVAQAQTATTGGATKIGVISAIDNSVAYQWGGAGPKTDVSAGDVSTWGLDEVIVTAAKTRLAARYSVVPIAADRAAINQLFGGVGPKAGGPSPTIEQVLHTALKQPTPAVDLYLVVSSDKSGDFIGVSNVQMIGLGVYRRVSHSIQVYAVGEAILVDARSFKVLERAPLRTSSGSPHAHGPVDKAVASARFFEQLDTSQKAQVKTALQELLRQSLDYTLKDMKFAR
jgi:hypothetical protein